MTDARTNKETWVIARTDAIAVERLSVALDRAETYIDAGADILLVKAPRNRAQLKQIADQFERCHRTATISRAKPLSSVQALAGWSRHCLRGNKGILVIEVVANHCESTALSAGLILATGSEIQRVTGIKDCAELFAKDIQAKAQTVNDQMRAAHVGV